MPFTFFLETIFSVSCLHSASALRESKFRLSSKSRQPFHFQDNCVLSHLSTSACTFKHIELDYFIILAPAEDSITLSYPSSDKRLDP